METSIGRNGRYRQIFPDGVEGPGTEVLMEADGDTPFSKKYFYEIKGFREAFHPDVFCTPLTSFGTLRFFSSENHAVLALDASLPRKAVGKVDLLNWKIAVRNSDDILIHLACGKSRIDPGAKVCDFYVVDLLLFELNRTEEFLPDGIMRVMFDLEWLNSSEESTKMKLRTKELARDLKQLKISSDASDATIHVKGRDFRVHRCILAARTPVFSSMFQHKMLERETGAVDIDDCEPETFEKFLQYVYCGEVSDGPPESLCALYEVADKYQVNELKADCLDFIKKGLSVNSFCSAMVLAHLHTESDLLRQATEFFIKNIKEIIVTSEWQQYLVNYPTQANELFIKALVDTPGQACSQ